MDPSSNLVTWLTGPSLISASLLCLSLAWAAWTKWVSRSFESGLLIDVSVSTKQLTQQGTHLVHLTTTLTNCGHRKLEAPELLTREILENSGAGWIDYVGDLQIRRINPALPVGSYAEFWDNAATSAVTPEHISILDEYERVRLIDGRRMSTINFFMEPGEACKLSTTLVLDGGEYLAKVVVLGDRQPEEFWSQIVWFSVPGGTVTLPPSNGRCANRDEED